MKLLYASDSESQKDIPLSFYGKQRERFHAGEKDDDFRKRSAGIDLKIRKQIKKIQDEIKRMKELK